MTRLSLRPVPLRGGLVTRRVAAARLLTTPRVRRLVGGGCGGGRRRGRVRPRVSRVGPGVGRPRRLGTPLRRVLQAVQQTVPAVHVLQQVPDITDAARLVQRVRARLVRVPGGARLLLHWWPRRRPPVPLTITAVCLLLRLEVFALLLLAVGAGGQLVRVGPLGGGGGGCSSGGGRHVRCRLMCRTGRAAVVCNTCGQRTAHSYTAAQKLYGLQFSERTKI